MLAPHGFLHLAHIGVRIRGVDRLEKDVHLAGGNVPCPGIDVAAHHAQAQRVQPLDDDAGRGRAYSRQQRRFHAFASPCRRAASPRSMSMR